MDRLSPTSAVTRTARSAFTLVELLVVIGIIAVLIGILLPSLQKARQQAQTVVCQTQLREIGNSFHIYLADNKGNGNMSVFTVTPPDTGFSATQKYWFAKYRYIGLLTNQEWDFSEGFLSAYFKSRRLTDCPNTDDFVNPASYSPEVPKLSYAYNVQANAPSIGVNAKKTWRYANIKKPTETMALLDALTVNANGTANFDYVSNGFGTNSSNSNRTPNFHGRHRGGVGNVLWYDGHVTSETPFIPVVDIDIETAKRNRLPFLTRLNVGYLTPYSTKSLPTGVTTLDGAHQMWLTDKNTKSPGYYYWTNKIDKP